MNWFVSWLYKVKVSCDPSEDISKPRMVQEQKNAQLASPGSFSNMKKKLEPKWH